ncbi:MAG: hypothetical protein FWB80_13095 [Defluviitaleaceae bacterium]|nr:hypothetical protein [Defluviitaleaceae bacterium]
MDTAKLIERLDQDRRDSELRLQNSMDSLKRELREDRQQTEQRLDDRMAEERRLSEQREERMEKRFSESMARFDKTTGELKNDVNHLKWWILGVCMATIIGIASMIITVILN